MLLLEWCVWRTKVETTPELLRHQALTLLQVLHVHACMHACMLGAHVRLRRIFRLWPQLSLQRLLHA